MKVIKTTDKKEERSLIAIGEVLKELPKKLGNFFSANRRRTLIICCSVLLIGAAIFLNWKLFGEESASKNYAAGEKDDDGKTVDNETDDDTKDVDENNGESYFALAVIDRQKSRDEAIEVLQTVIDSSDAAEEEKEQAIASIAKIAADIESEANIETLIKAKGFENCIAVINEDGAKIIVETTQTLLPNQLAQIQEIVYDESGVVPENIKIIEKTVITSES